MYTRHTKESLTPIVSSSQSYSECLRKLGLRVAGGNYDHLQRNIEKFGLDTSHMLHQAHNRGKELKPYEGLTGKTSIKKRFISQSEHRCNKCKLTHWLDQPIMLEIEHIDGNNRNNSKDNLLLLCPNCHSQTPTWRNRKRT